MKALSLTLLFVIILPLGLLAGPDVAVEAAEENKLTMITNKFGVSVPTLVAQMVNFCLVALALYFLAVKPVVATLDERQQKIADGLQYAEEMKTQLAEAERERAEKVKQAAIEAQAILTEAREQSKEMIEQKTQEAAAQAEAIIRKATEATELEHVWSSRPPPRCFPAIFLLKRRAISPSPQPKNWPMSSEASVMIHHTSAIQF
jgi:F-type H+-transporting ATPase subunit b